MHGSLFQCLTALSMQKSSPISNLSLLWWNVRVFPSGSVTCYLKKRDWVPRECFLRPFGIAHNLVMLKSQLSLSSAVVINAWDFCIQTLGLSLLSREKKKKTYLKYYGITELWIVYCQLGRMPIRNIWCFNDRQSILFLQLPAWISAQVEGTWWPETYCLMSLLSIWLWGCSKAICCVCGPSGMDQICSNSYLRHRISSLAI